MYISVSFCQMIKAWTPAFLGYQAGRRPYLNRTSLLSLLVLRNGNTLRCVYVVGCLVPH